MTITITDQHGSSSITDVGNDLTATGAAELAFRALLGAGYETESIVAAFTEVAAQHDTTNNETEQ
jgi:hypothetical protein